MLSGSPVPCSQVLNSNPGRSLAIEWADLLRDIGPPAGSDHQEGW